MRGKTDSRCGICNRAPAEHSDRERFTHALDYQRAIERGAMGDKTTPEVGSEEWHATVQRNRAAGWRCGRGLVEGFCDDPAHARHESHFTAASFGPDVLAERVAAIGEAIELATEGGKTDPAEVFDWLADAGWVLVRAPGVRETVDLGPAPHVSVQQYASAERGYEEEIVEWTTDRSRAESEAAGYTKTGLDVRVVVRTVTTSDLRDAD